MGLYHEICKYSEVEIILHVVPVSPERSLSQPSSESAGIRTCQLRRLVEDATLGTLSLHEIQDIPSDEFCGVQEERKTERMVLGYHRSTSTEPSETQDKKTPCVNNGVSRYTPS